MKVKLLGHTQVVRNTEDGCSMSEMELMKDTYEVTDGQLIALAAIRQCYSHKTAIEVLETEGNKYFGEKAVESKRLFNHIVRSGHVSTMEHINFTFAIEGVSRALLAQLTRHRVGWSYSVQSQRYIKMSSDSRLGGFGYVVPDKIDWVLIDSQGYDDEKYNRMLEAHYLFERTMETIQNAYDELVELGVPQEDARAVLPNATTTNLVVTCNLRALIDFVGKRDRSKGAQSEIAQLAEIMKQKVKAVEPRLAEFLEGTE